MSMSLDDRDRVKRAMAKESRLNQEQRLKTRRENDASRKSRQRLYCTIGKLVVKHFPELLYYEAFTIDGIDGTEYESLDRILSTIAELNSLTDMLKAEMHPKQ